MSQPWIGLGSGLNGSRLSGWDRPPGLDAPAR